MWQWVCGNLVNCNFIWDYVLLKHNINWRDKVLHVGPALLTSVQALFIEEQPFITIKFQAHHVHLGCLDKAKEIFIINLEHYALINSLGSNQWFVLFCLFTILTTRHTIN